MSSCFASSGSSERGTFTGVDFTSANRTATFPSKRSAKSKGWSRETVGERPPVSSHGDPEISLPPLAL